MIAVSKHKRGQLLFLGPVGDGAPDVYLQVEMELEEPLVVEIESPLVVTLEDPLLAEKEALATELEPPIEVEQE
jgi:hypothetical protein